MKTLLVKAALGVGLLAAAGAYAEAPAGATAECKDGTYYSGTTHKGACRGHQGVKSWIGSSTAGASSAAAADTSSDTATSKKTTKSKKAATDTAAPTAASASSGSAAGATALCKDGTYYNGATHKGACRGHQGVKDWLDNKSSAAPAAAPAASAAPAPTAAPAPSAAPAATPKAATEHKAPTPASEIAQKAGGGPGLVWVNSSSKVYHCQGDEWYGKTKEGSYMSEAAAKAEGDHAAHGKECGK